MEPEVVFHSVGIITEDRAEINTPLPINENQSPVLYTLKEGTKYCLKLTFSVRHNIVSGLTYCNTVWKAGHQGKFSFSFHYKNARLDLCKPSELLDIPTSEKTWLLNTSRNSFSQDVFRLSHLLGIILTVSVTQTNKI